MSSLLSSGSSSAAPLTPALGSKLMRAVSSCSGVTRTSEADVPAALGETVPYFSLHFSKSVNASVSDLDSIIRVFYQCNCVKYVQLIPADP